MSSNLHKEGIKKYIKKAKDTCGFLEVPGYFPVKRLKKVKRMAGELAEDEFHLLSAEKSFQRECFDVFDRIRSEIDKRANIYHSVSSDLNFLSGKSLNDYSDSLLEKCAAHLGEKYAKDIDTVEIVNDEVTFKYRKRADKEQK